MVNNAVKLRQESGANQEIVALFFYKNSSDCQH